MKILQAEGKDAPKIVLFRYQVGSESTEQRERGFEDYVNQRMEEQKKAGKPTITWLSRDKYAGATTDSAERELILRTLKRTGGNKTRAAEILDISLKTLHNKLHRYNA